VRLASVLFKKSSSFSDIPQDLFFAYGAALCVSGMDHDRFSNDDFAGNGFVRLMSIPQVHSEENCGAMIANFITIFCGFSGEKAKSFLVPLTLYDIDNLSSTMIYEVRKAE
jgi:hypothetical protein